MPLTDREKDVIRGVLAVIAGERLRLNNEESVAESTALKHQEAGRQLKDAYDDLRRLLKINEDQ